MRSIRALGCLFSEAPRWQLVALFMLMIMAGLTEGIGIMLLVPLLGVVAGAPSGHALIQFLLQALSIAGIVPTLGGLLLAFLIVMAIRSAVQYGQTRLGARLQLRLVDKLRVKCFTTLRTMEWQWIINTRRSDHANLLLADVTRVGVGLSYGLALLATCLTVLVYLVVVLALSWTMASVILLSGGLALGLLTMQRRKALSLGDALTRANCALQSKVQESLAGLKLAKILAIEQRHLDAFVETTEQLRKQHLSFVASTSLSRALLQFTAACLVAGYLYIGVRVWSVPAAELLVLVLMFARLVPQLISAQQQLHHWLHALPALEETQRLLNSCRAKAEPLTTSYPDSWIVKDAVCLKEVTFSYSDPARPELHQVSVCFRAHTTTAIIGVSGAGKTTVADILVGLLTPDSGTLTVDGVPITGAARRAWRRHVAYVPQEVFLFHDSIRNNLLWGQPSATDRQLRLALRRAAADFVFALPKGWDTIVGDSGERLSGGQRQRLGLARALLKQPSLLILDEATNALDLENQAQISELIDRLHGDLTVAIIGHHLPTLKHADQVIVLSAGRVTAQGTWWEVRGQYESTNKSPARHTDL